MRNITAEEQQPTNAHTVFSNVSNNRVRANTHRSKHRHTGLKWEGGWFIFTYWSAIKAKQCNPWQRLLPFWTRAAATKWSGSALSRKQTWNRKGSNLMKLWDLICWILFMSQELLRVLEQHGVQSHIVTINAVLSAKSLEFYNPKCSWNFWMRLEVFYLPQRDRSKLTG